MAKKTVAAHTPESIVRDVRAGKIAPVYYLMGDESYYIDHVSNFLVDHLLSPEERDFNLITFFGAETDMQSVCHAAMGFPMGAQRLVVWVKEAQALKDLERLDHYLKQPQTSTVVIFCHKNGSLDRRKSIVKVLEKQAVLMESTRLRDYQLPSWISNYLRRKRRTIEPAAAEMMADFVGADLNRMAGELDKLILATSEAQNLVTTDLVSDHIGISKEYNIFELTDALGKKDVVKANRIANYFEKNPKQNPIQGTLPPLFRYFSNLMLAYYAPDKSKQGIAAWLGISEWQVEKNILPAMRMYSGRKVMDIIGQIRRTDARSKGVDNPSIPAGDLFKELLFFILH